YITANPDDLLLDALGATEIEDGICKRPVEQLYPWREILDGAARESPPDPLKPSVREPIVYRLFGSFRDVQTLVLTEDDYFKYLLTLSRHPDRAQHSLAQRILAKSGLLFLGFQIDDWDFRVFFHFLRNRENRYLNKLLANTDIAVQIDPEDVHGTELARVPR